MGTYRKTAKLYAALASLITISVSISLGLFFDLTKVNATDVTGTISTNTTWTLVNSPYNITGNIDVNNGAILTIDAGVEVRSNGNYYLRVSNGSLDVNGTSGNEVVFRHNTSTLAGQWVGIQILNTTGSATIDFMEIYHANTGIRVEQGTASINDSLFDTNYTGVDVIERGTITTARNTFSKNTYFPLVLNSDVGTVSLGSGVDADILETGADINGYNAIGVAYNDYVSNNCPSDLCKFSQRTFAGITNIPYVIHRDYYIDGSGDELEIDAGVIIKNRINVDLNLRYGAILDVNGTSGSEVIFTSERDDDYGGDTNNDGTATSPAANNWARILPQAGNTHTIDFAKILYGNTAVMVSGTGIKVTVQDTLFESNSAGITVDERAELTTARNTFNKQVYYPINLNTDVGTVSLGSGVDADILGTGADINGYNAIGVAYNDYVSNNCPSDLCKFSQRTFAGITNIPYVIHRDYYIDGSGDELEIDAGVIIKNRINVDLNLRYGAILDVNGTSGNEVIFTSERDDDYGGDTNNDGTTTSSAVNDWVRIVFQAGNTHTIDFAKILYGNTPVRAAGTGAKVTVQDTVIESSSAGIVIDERAELTTARNTFNKQVYYPIGLNADVGTVSLGSGVDADVLGTGADINGYNAIGVAYNDYVSNNCPSDLCKFSQRTFAGITNIPYVVHQDYYIDGSGDKLEIDAGVIIKNRINVDLNLRYGAILDVNGTSGNEVILTSERDDDYGGDTNNDGTATSPAANDWVRIVFQAGNTHTIDFAKILYGNTPVRAAGTGAKVTVQDTVIESSSAGIVIDERAELTTARNTFNKQVYYPINLNADVGTVSLGSGVDADVLGTGADVNGYNAIGVAVSDNISNNCPSDLCKFSQRTFAGITNIPYVIHQDYYVNGSGDELEIDAGVIIKNRAGVDLFVRDGAFLDINGVNNDYVYFTSDTNDFIGGDTNNDGTVTSPARNNWYALRLEGTGAHVVDYLDCSYADRCMFINGATNVNLANSNFRESTYGIYSTPTSVPIVSQLNIENNYTYGFYNNVSTPISAENNWWGSDDGPLDSDAGGQCVANSGSGDTVSDDALHQIDYCPYATSMLRAPSVTTDITSDINENSAVGNGTIGSFGYYPAIQHGHIWDTTANPEIFYPIAYWKMNDNAASSTVVDSTGGNDGTFHGTGGTDDYTSNHTVTGKVNSALSFDGTNDYIDLPVAAPALPFTLTMWVMPNSATPVGIFDSASGQQNVLRNYPAGYVEWWSNSPQIQLNLSAGIWQQLVFIFYYDGNRKIDYYKDGEYQTTGTGSTNSAFAWTTFRLGNINGGSAGRYAGSIDDFRIYNTKLPSDEISKIYNSGSGTEETDFYLGKTENGPISTGGVFTSNIFDLDESTTYFTRAYIQAGDGAYYYGSDDSFTTTGGNTLPVASSVSVDGGAASIDLTEGTTTEVTCTAVVTDADGYGNITSVEAKFYRTGIGHTAEDDNNNHYTVAGDTECVPSGGSGSTENYTCTIDVYFHADPTDVGSAYSADDWTCRITPSDSVGVGSSSLDTIEMNSLLAFSTTMSLGYGALDLGADTGASNEITTITNTGNSPIDIELSGDDMCPDYPVCSGHIVTVDKQEYSTSSFTYGTGTDLSVTPTLVDTNISKPTTSPSNSTGDILWGISIPVTVIGGLYTGLNTFTATSAD